MIINVRAIFNRQQVQQQLNEAKKQAQIALNTQVIKDSNYYAPEDTGTLQDSALLSTDLESGKVFWNTKYARRLYYNPQYNFSKDKNPNAQGFWFEAAKAQHKAEWIEMAKAIYGDAFKGQG